MELSIGFEGQWVNGVMDGFGSFTFTNLINKKTCKEEVCWKANMKEGPFTQECADGSMKKGFMFHSKIEDNLGFQKFPNGDTWEGPFWNNKKHGQGRYVQHFTGRRFKRCYAEDLHVWDKDCPEPPKALDAVVARKLQWDEAANMEPEKQCHVPAD